MEKLINNYYCIMVDCMGAEIFDSDETISRMCLRKTHDMTEDEELAMHIIHKFNICRDTLETMPAFDEHIQPLFTRIKEK